MFVSDWLDDLVGYWASFSNFLARQAANSHDWLPLFKFLTHIMDGLSSGVDLIFSGFFDFSRAFRQLENQIRDLLSWETILAGFDWIRERINSVWSWFSSWWDHVLSVITYWWTGTADQVWSWISTAADGLAGILTAWEEFRTSVLPTLFDLGTLEDWYRAKLLDIGDLIRSAFTEREMLWKDWDEMRHNVTDFFDDPLEWLWTRFTDWFLGRE